MLLLPFAGALISSLGASISKRWTGSGPSGTQLLLCTLGGAGTGSLLWLVSDLSMISALAAAALLGLLVATSLTEVQANLVPNEVVLAGVVIAVIPRLLGASLVDGLLGGLGLSGALLFFTLATGGSLGLGSVKMGGAIGLLLGWQLSFVWLVTCLALGLVSYGTMALASIRRSSVPSSPLWMVGVIVAIWVGPHVLRMLW